MELINDVSNFVELINGLQDRWNFIYKEVHYTNLKQQDLLHEIENVDSEDLSEVALGLKRIRKYRRALLNEQALLKPLLQWSREGKKFDELGDVIDHMLRLQTLQRNWHYDSRIVEVECVA